VYRLFVDSSAGVSIDPEWDYASTDRKVENRSMGRSGLSEVYKYGEFIGRNFSLRYVDSATASVINSWWASNTPLLFMREGDTEVSTVLLANEKTPIGKLERPYAGQFSGTIELGGY